MQLGQAVTAWDDEEYMALEHIVLKAWTTAALSTTACMFNQLLAIASNRLPANFDSVKCSC